MNERQTPNQQNASCADSSIKMTVIKVSIKWSGKKFDDVPLDLELPAKAFKDQLFKLTNVEPPRQKIMVKGGLLKVRLNPSCLTMKRMKPT
jgi:ubiquitin carboxyl-terminal hydrolase 14